MVRARWVYSHHIGGSESSVRETHRAVRKLLNCLRESKRKQWVLRKVIPMTPSHWPSYRSDSAPGGWQKPGKSICKTKGTPSILGGGGTRASRCLRGACPRTGVVKDSIPVVSRVQLCCGRWLVEKILVEAAGSNADPKPLPVD